MLGYTIDSRFRKSKVRELSNDIPYAAVVSKSSAMRDGIGSAISRLTLILSYPVNNKSESLQSLHRVRHMHGKCAKFGIKKILTFFFARTWFFHRNLYVAYLNGFCTALFTDNKPKSVLNQCAGNLIWQSKI